MDRPRAVVGVIRGVAKIVDVSCLFWAVSGIYGVRYLSLRAICYFSMLQCATWPARESKVCPRQSRMEGYEPAHLLLLYNDCLVTEHP